MWSLKGAEPFSEVRPSGSNRHTLEANAALPVGTSPSIWRGQWLGGNLAVWFLLTAVWLGLCAGAFLV
jgi:hypothetical protein